MQRHMPTHWIKNKHILVTDGDWPYYDKLKGHALIVFVRELNDINRIINEVRTPTKLHAVVYENRLLSLESVAIDPHWSDTPIILRIGRLGQFRNVTQKIEQLKSMNIMITLTSDHAQNYRDVQILSSLGVHAGIDLSDTDVNWDACKDLIAYAFYGRMKHADIEPFDAMCTYYCGRNYVSPQMAMFYNPERYIHVDQCGHLAFSRSQLKQGDFFDTGWEQLANISIHPAIKDEAHKWQQLFIENHVCTSCPAFRVCLAYFKDQQESGECRKAMMDLLDGIEFKKSQQSKEEQLCQL